MASAFADILTQQSLREQSGFRAFRDGHKYFERGQVYALSEDHNTIRAKVLGLYEYSIQLRLAETELDHDCTCPAGKQSFCKHAVAVGLTWLAESGDAPVTSSIEQTRKDPVDIIKMFLALQDRPALIELILEQAAQDDRLQERLLFKIAGAKGKRGIDINTFRQLIDDIAGAGVEMEALSDGYIERLTGVVTALSDLLGEGQATAAYELTEYTLDAVEKVLETFEDRDNRIDDLLFRLQDLHLAVCRAAAPDPKALAKRLFEWRLDPVWDVFYDVMATYADVLTDEGLAEYRLLAETTWSELPELKPGDDPPERFGRRFRLTYIMETLAREKDDVEAVIRIKQKDLSQPDDFLSIAETYDAAGNADSALEWAERGMKAFPERQDPSLKAFLVKAYERQGRVYEG